MVETIRRQARTTGCCAPIGRCESGQRRSVGDSSIMARRCEGRVAHIKNCAVVRYVQKARLNNVLQI